MANAWHLRNDGKAFPVEVHLYPMQDNNLASEAEVAAFIISTNSKDQDLAEYVLDCYMALLLENERTTTLTQGVDAIEEAIVRQLSHLPYHFAYPLDINEMLKIHQVQNNFTDFESLSNFYDEIYSSLDSIQQKIKDSFNQQFCRVRYGGKLNTISGNNCIWFRIASVGYNWDDIIYMFTADMLNQLNIKFITICRDAESDGSNKEYFYRAKDKTVYHYLPVDEFFSEEHEKNPVFSSSSAGAGVIWNIRKELRRGNTILGAYDWLEKQGITCNKDYRPYFYKQELEQNWIEASQWFEELATRTKMKISKMIAAIKRRFPEILDMDVDYNERENKKGNPVGFELLCTLVSDHPKIDNTTIGIASTKSLSSTTAETLVRMFQIEYGDFIKFSGIKV